MGEIEVTSTRFAWSQSLPGSSGRAILRDDWIEGRGLVHISRFLTQGSKRSPDGAPQLAETSARCVRQPSVAGRQEIPSDEIFMNGLSWWKIEATPLV